MGNASIKEYRSIVKVNGLQAAKEKAITLAGAIDQSIGKAIYILEKRDYGFGHINRMASGYSNIVVSANEIMIRPDQKLTNLEFEKIKLEYEL